VAVPTRAEAVAILAGRDLPDWLVAHSRGVARVAAAAARALVRNGIDVDVGLVETAALLHDIDKLATREDGAAHGTLAATWLAELGHPELGRAVAAHPLVRLLEPDPFGGDWPSMLVHLADRHYGAKFLTVDERIDDMARRHPRFRDEIEQARAATHALETRVAAAAGMTTDELVAELRVAAEAEVPV